MAVVVVLAVGLAMVVDGGEGGGSQGCGVGGKGGGVGGGGGDIRRPNMTNSSHYSYQIVLMFTLGHSYL